jgi:Protein of unknown function (DUF2865)
MVVHAVEVSGVLGLLAGKVVGLTGARVATAGTVILWSFAFLSAIFDSIPFVATMIPLLKSMAPAYGGRRRSSLCGGASRLALASAATAPSSAPRRTSLSPALPSATATASGVPDTRADDAGVDRESVRSTSGPILLIDLTFLLGSRREGSGHSPFVCHNRQSAIYWRPVLRGRVSGPSRRYCGGEGGNHPDVGHVACPDGAWLRGVAVARSHRERPWTWRLLAAGALAAASILALPGAAHAGFLDFLFGGPQQQPAPPAGSYAEPPGAPTVRRAPDGTREEGGGGGGGGGGRYVAYCVRLCDGHHFPLEHMANAMPIETCRAMCPASKTKVFFGSGIDRAAARDGQRYTDLDGAYVYRDHLVANCTCNGRDAFGLARFEATSDPTLRAGDIVATKNGMLAFSGRSGQGATFSPVDEAAVAAELNKASSRARLTQRAAPAPAAEEEPGTIVQPDADMQADMRGQPTR